MDLGTLKTFRTALNGFTQEFEGCIKTRASRTHLRTYLNGQLGPLERKSIEPMALAAKVPPRTLQEFLSIHRWDEKAVGRRLRAITIRDHADPNGIVVIDETSFAKKGSKTAGVQRQHCGSTGKTDNCVVTVHLGYATSDFHCLLDGDLYLPEASWSQDRTRCRAAGIPDDVVYRPKWRIALELVGRSRTEGVPMRYATADEAYSLGGKKSGWTPPQVRQAVEVQLDPGMSRHERRRRLESALATILHWQRRNAKAVYYHDKRRSKELRAAGVDLRKVRHCPLRI